MFFKNYQNLGKTTEMVTTFGGYCRRDVIGDGQFFEMENMSARKYPAITTRQKRQMLTMVNGEAVGNIAAMVDMDGLVWLGKDGSLHAGGHALENFYTYTEADRQMIPMGGYLIVWPDKVWANAVKLRMGQEMVRDEDYGDLEAYWQQADDANSHNRNPPQYFSQNGIHSVRVHRDPLSTIILQTTAGLSPRRWAESLPHCRREYSSSHQKTGLHARSVPLY